MNTTELVLSQESFFSQALTGNEIAWQKESQFAIQAMGSNDYLAKAAISNPVSFQNAIINIAAIGISLNPALKHAYLVPRSMGKDKPVAVCLDISYQGLIHLATMSGAILWGQAKLVYENDTFKNIGIDKAPLHEQDTFGDKGKVVGVYCTVKTPSGDFLTETMDRAALLKVQHTSKAKNGPWKTWWDEMARKSVVKRAYKYWPKTEALSQAIQVINDHEGLEVSDNDIQYDVVADYCGEDQIDKLTTAIEKSGMTVDRFCSHKKININDLSEFNPARLEGAIAWLKKEGKKNEDN